MSSSQTQCLISDSRACKASGITDEVFIIGSGSPEFKPDVDAILDVLKGVDFPGNFALLSEKAKGLDAFCDKICSKIREAQFCIVLLNDPYSSEVTTLRVPSANVYYEFGMAVAQRKNVIPIIKRGLPLPFDVQHLDVIIYDNIEDLKSKLKAPIVTTLRKQKTPLVNDELQKQVYGPLYNEIDRFLARADKFTIFHKHQISIIFSSYKYLFDKTHPEFQHKILKFYSDADEFNGCLGVAQKAISEIVQKEVKRRFNVDKSSPSRIKVEIISESGQNISPSLEQILLHKVTANSWYEAFKSAEKVVKVNYYLETQGYVDKKLDLARGNRFFEFCQEKVEKDPRVIKIREMEQKLNMEERELLGMLKKLL